MNYTQQIYAGHILAGHKMNRHRSDDRKGRIDICEDVKGVVSREFGRRFSEKLFEQVASRYIEEGVESISD